jgi:hypothetical protein
MKRLLAFIPLLALAACDSISPTDRAAFAPPPPPSDCHCDDSQNQRGFAFKGRIVAVLAGQDELRVLFDEIPGAMPAGTREFKTAPEVLPAVQPGQEILARIEWRGGEWWIFDVRRLIPVPTADAR